MEKKQQAAIKERQERFNKIFQIMNIYIKYLLADEITIEEENTFLDYCQHSIYHKPIITKNTQLIMQDPTQYLTENDYSMGDLILQFPNPDEMSFNVITCKEALTFLKQTVETRCAIEFQNELLDYAILQMAFLHAYSKLMDTKIDDINLNKEGHEISTQFLESAIKLFFKGKNEDLEISEIPNEFVHIIQCKILASLNKNYHEPKYTSKQKRLIAHVVKKKLLTKGKFLFKTVQGPERSQHLVQDFLTLARNLILLRLSQKGFKVRTFISSDSSSIFAVIFSAESNISIVAEQIKMKKFLNLEFTDLLSLEPIDNNYRPLRLNNRLWRSDQDQSLSDYFQYVKPKIINLLKKINFKKMAKELHIQNINDQMFDYGQRDLIGDDEGPSDELWEAYYEYLIYLESRVTEARQKFYFKLDFAVEMNPKRKKQQSQKASSSKSQLKRESKKFTVHQTAAIIEETTRTQKEEQQIKRYFSYWRKKKFIPAKKSLKKHQQVKELRENPLTICETQKTDFTQIILEQLKRILIELKIEINNQNESVEAYLKKLQLYFDEEEDAEVILKQLFQQEQNLACQEIIQQLCILMKDTENPIQKSYSITRDKNPVYYETIMRQLIEQLVLTYMKQEESVWKQQIQDEREQFQNMKKVLHLKWDQLCTKFLKERQRELLAQSYGNAMRDGMLIINNAKGNQLKCIWDYSFGELFDIAISSEYSVAAKGFSFKKKSRINTIWRKYQVSESGRISVFSIMERIKLVNYIVNQTINIPFIFNEHYLLQLFALNDQYELQGLSNKRLFQNDQKSIIQTPGSEHQEYIKLLQERNLISESLFVKPKLHNLDEVWRIRWGQIWYVPQNEIRDYYGEKIALYFSFLGHYTKSLLLPGIIGLICSIVQFLTPQSIGLVFGMIFGIGNSSFLALMNGTWKLKEKEIVAQFAQNINKGDQQQEQRPAFKGEYRRDPQNDEFNTLYYPFSKLFAHMIFNGLMLGCVFSIYLGSVIGLFYMTKFLYDYNVFASLEKLSVLKLEVSIPCIINVILLSIFDYFYENLAENMTDQENHKTVNEFESNFIIKKFTLLLLSYFAPIFMITFLNTELGIDCAYDDCYLNGSYYFSSIFIILFLFNIKEVVTPIINSFLNKPKEEPKSQEEFSQVNNYIENEAQKDSYFKSVDRYGTVDDYMEIIIQSGLLGLFSPLFPASMFIGFVWNSLEMQTDKMKLIKYSQRPIPLDEQSIGIWSSLLDFLANLSILYNTGVVFLMGKKHPTRQGDEPLLIQDVTMFLIIILVSFAIRFIIETLIPEATFEFISIMKRQQYLLKSTIETFKKKTGKMSRLKRERNNLSRYVLFKPYGTILKIEKKKRAVAIQEEEDENESEMDIQGEDMGDKGRDTDTQRNQMQQIVLAEKASILLHKNVYHYDFPTKKFEVAHLQKEYDNKIERLKRMLQYFERYYTLKWCEQRLLYRRLYQRRKFILYKSLNVRKLKVFIISYRDLYHRFQKQQEAKREAGVVEDVNDREQRTARINNIAKKKTKQAVKRTVLLKSKGVWFGQFRRQVPILRAQDMIKHLKKIEILQNKQKTAQKLVPISAIKVTKDTLQKHRPRIYEQINCLDVSKSSSQEIIKLLIQTKDQYITRDQYKSQLVRNIEELYSLQTRKIEHIQSYLYHQELPNYLSLSQEELKGLFIQNQKALLRNQDFVLLKMIQKESQKEVWLIKQDYQLKILETIQIDLKYNNILFEDLMLQEYSLFDQFFNPNSKGIIGKIIDSRYELLNGWTLFDTVKFRKSVELYYQEQELLQFLLNLLNSFNDFKQQTVITPKSIYANRNRDRIGYTFHWMMYGNRDMVENEYIPKNEDNNLPKMVYNAGMIIVYMMTLGEIQENLDFLIDQQAKLMNQYPIVFTIVSDMLLSEKQRKSYLYIKQLCSNECQSKDLYVEDKRITLQIIEDSKLPEYNYQELKLYDQNELSNQSQTEQLHHILSQQLFKMDLCFKFKLLKQLKFELHKCNEIASIIYNQENVFIHIQSNFQFYCDKPVHQKLLFDFISIEFYRALYQFSLNLTLDGIYLQQFIPVLNDTYLFLSKIEKYTSQAILEEFDQQSDILVIRKRLRVQAENYKNIHLKLQQIRVKFLFLQAYGEMFVQNQSRAVDLFFQASKLNFNKIKGLIIQINIAKLQKEKYYCIQQLRKINCDIEYYQLKITNLILKLQLDNECYGEIINQCQIIKPSPTQCIFVQLIHSETLILHSQAQWCLDQYQNNFDYLRDWIDKYKKTKSKHLELPLLGLYSLEQGINVLYYNYDIHLVEDFLQILYQFNDKHLFLINYLQYKLLQIINIQLGVINYGIITQFDENSLVGEKRLLKDSYEFLPKTIVRKSDYMSDLYFELECNLQMPMDYDQYLDHNESHIVARRGLIIAKLLYAAQRYPAAKLELNKTNCKIEGLIEAWKMKNNKMIDQFYDCKFSLNDLSSWKNLFVTFIFDLNILHAQLVCKFAFKLIECSTAPDKGYHIQVLQQFKIFMVKLLLEEYNDKNNNYYIEKSFEIKFFILSTLNQYLQELSLNLLSDICDIEDRIKQKELLDYKDVTIPVDQRELDKKNICLNDLFVVQSQLLEESGDPVAALKCLDVQYALMLYDERFNKQVQRVFSRRLEHDDPNLLVSKCKVAIMKLFLNIFSTCGQQLLKIRKQALDCCVQIITLTSEQSKQKINEFPSNKIIWDEFALKILNYAKPKQLEAFQKYKLIYYQVEWKLLEFYAITGDYKEAQRQFQYLFNHYNQLQKDEDYVKKYFEYSFGVYFIYIRETEKAYQFFDLAVKRFKKKMIYDEDLKIPFVKVTGNFKDKFTDDKLIVDLLDQFNHLFTLRSRCSLCRCYVKIYEKKTKFPLFRSLVRLIEKIRKTVGRKSILYVDALMTYSEYLLRNKEENNFQNVKIDFKTQYFYTRRETEFFEPYIYKSTLAYKFATPEDIEDRLSEQLISQWIFDLLDQCYRFYKEYFSQVNVQEHYSIVYCDILQYRIAFNTGRLYQAQQMLDRALENLEKLCPTFDHPYGVMIYEGYALLCENMEKVQEENVKIILECASYSQLNKLTADERYKIVVQIYLRNEQLSKYFDDYKNNGFELYLLQKLEKFLEKKQTTERTSMKVGKLQRKQTNLDVGKQIQIRMQAKAEALSNQDKIIDKKFKIGNIGYYRKAYKICKMIFRGPNPLYTKIEDRFIELSRKEQREAIQD